MVVYLSIPIYIYIYIYIYTQTYSVPLLGTTISDSFQDGRATAPEFAALRLSQQKGARELYALQVLGGAFFQGRRRRDGKGMGKPKENDQAMDVSENWINPMIAYDRPFNGKLVKLVMNQTMKLDARFRDKPMLCFFVPMFFHMLFFCWLLESNPKKFQQVCESFF